MPKLRQLIPSAGALYVFEEAAKRRSFTAAAEELGVTQAAVSYAVKQLEAALGVSLFLRHHRSVELTEVGERFYHDVAIGLAHIRRSAESISENAASNQVTLSSSTAFASHWLLPRLTGFHKGHPDIDLRIQTSEKDVDLLAEGISLGIRRGPERWPAYRAALLAPEEILAVASPEFLRGTAPINSLADLAQAKLIHLEEPVRPRPTWKDWFASFEIAFQDRGEGLRLNDYALVLQAALEGEGIAMGWRHVTERLLRSGLLKPVVTESFRSDKGFYLLWARRRPLSAEAGQVRDWLLGQV